MIIYGLNFLIVSQENTVLNAAFTKAEGKIIQALVVLWFQKEQIPSLVNFGKKFLWIGLQLQTISFKDENVYWKR